MDKNKIKEVEENLNEIKLTIPNRKLLYNEAKFVYEVTLKDNE
jgi:hypothetical protein